MTKVIVYQNSDGRLSVDYPEYKNKTPEVTEEDFLLAVAKRVVPEGVTFKIIEESELPKSRNYRNAWEWDNDKAYSISLDKAKELQKEMIVRKAKERIPRDEWGDQDLTTIKAELDALDIDNAKDLNELYNKWPKSIETRKSKRAYIE